MSHESLRRFFESRPIPTDPTQLVSLQKDAVTLIPRITRNPNHKLLPDIHAARSCLRHLMKQRLGSDRYNVARQQCRDSLTDFINHDIEGQLDAALDPDFFKFTKRSIINCPVPPLQLNGQTHSGHAQSAKCLADHHRTGPRIRVSPSSQADIP